MFKTRELPNTLCVKDGVLSMQDGSDVQEYIRSFKKLANATEVVLITREEAQKLVYAANAYRTSQVFDYDDRFCLSA